MRARVGLLRHFPVRLPFPSGWKTAGELGAWFAEYDRAPVDAVPADLGGIDWKACLCSDLPRAVTTARAVYPGDPGSIETTDLLREIPFTPFDTGSLNLPVRVWHLLWKLAWFTGHRSQRACRDALRHRVSAIADRVEQSGTDLLLVSHAGFLGSLSGELRKRGYEGPPLGLARHAQAYVYEPGDGARARRTRPAPARRP